MAKYIGIISIFLVLSLLVSGGVAFFITKNATPKEQIGTLLKIGDAKEGLLISVGQTNNLRFLKVSVIIDYNATVKKENKGLSQEEIKIQDAIINILRSSTIEELDIKKEEQLKQKIKQELNQLFGKDKINKIYFTEFIIQ